MPFAFFIPNVTFGLDSKCSYGGFVKGVLETVAISDLKKTRSVQKYDLRIYCF